MPRKRTGQIEAPNARIEREADQRLQVIKGRIATLTKGVNDSSFGYQQTQNAVAPKAITNSVRAITPIEAYELCSAVRSAVRARNEPFGQVQIRLFTRDGREVEEGDAVRFFQKPSEYVDGQMFLQTLGNWTDLWGERMVWVHQPNLRIGGDRNEPGRLVGTVLNPAAARVVDPVLPRSIEEIRQWAYIWPENGRMTNISADEIAFAHEFNPSSSVRGNSPLYAVINSITASYQAQRYIRSFFGNNAIPSHIVNVETDNPDLIEPFKKEYLAAHQGEDKAWKAMFTYGKRVTVQNLENPVAVGEQSPFSSLLLAVRDEVSALYMVPPLHGGMWDKTRFDSVEAQNDFFYESVWIPRLSVMEKFCQQIVDRFFRFASVKGAQAVKLNKSQRWHFEKAKRQSGSDLVVVLDCDHIPAVAALKRRKVDYAERLQQVFHITPKEAAEEVGIELKLNDAADLVWYESKQQFMDEPKKVAEAQTEAAQNAAQPEEEATPTTDKAFSDDTLDGVRTFYRELRRITLERSEKKEHWTLKEADALAEKHGCKSPTVCREIRADYHAIRRLSDRGDQGAIKKHFNTKRPSLLRELAKAITIEAVGEDDAANKRRKAFLLALLAFFGWQAALLIQGGAATDGRFNTKLAALLAKHLGVAAVAKVTTPEASAIAANDVEEVASRMAPLLNETTDRNIQTAVSQGATREAAIDAALRKAAETRAVAIEDDMTHLGGVIGVVSQLKSEGRDVVWVTEADDRVCKICGPLHGQIVKAGDEFRPGIKWPVKDTHGNCRCLIVDANTGEIVERT